MKRLMFLSKAIGILLILFMAPQIQAQIHCMSGDLRCGGGGGWKPPAVPPTKSEEVEAPARLANLVGRRCDDVQALSPKECKTTQDDAFIDGCITETERAWLYAKSYSILCAAGRPLFVCPCSCFDRDVRIMMGDIEDPFWVPAVDISPLDYVVTLADNIKLSDIDASPRSFSSREIDYTTEGPERPDLYVLQLSNGNELALSEHHALLLQDGYMITAKELSTEHVLLSYTGEAVFIKNISRRPATDGHVYNFLVKGTSPESHLVVAEGVIVGDTMWQGSWSDRPGDQIMR